MSSIASATLVVIALPMESQGLFERENASLLFTGIGKVNATRALTRRLAQYNHTNTPLPTVLNFGTAGSQRHATGRILECTSFIQRDMDVTGLGVPPGHTPFDQLPARLDVQPAFPELPRGVCGSGDSFVVGPSAHDCDVLEMEAYALAKVCALEGCTFHAVKYVSDGADHSAATDWQSNLHRAAAQFIDLYRAFVNR